LDCRDERLAGRALGQGEEAATVDGRALAAQEALEVHPGAERLARAGDDAHEQVVVRVELIEDRRHLLRHGLRGGVLRLGTVEGDDEDVAADLGEDLGLRLLVLRHACSFASNASTVPSTWWCARPTPRVRPARVFSIAGGVVTAGDPRWALPPGPPSVAAGG